MEDETKTFEDYLNNFGRWLGKHITTIFAILISLYFIFSGTVQVLPTTLGIKEQVIVALLSIIAGYSITKLIGEQGFNVAKNTSEFIDKRKEYEASVKKGIVYREAIEEYSKDIARKNLKESRIGLLEGVGLYYYDIFDDNGNLLKEFNITKYVNDENYHKKIKVFKKCLKLRLQDTSVFSHSGYNKFGIKKRKTEKGYRNRKRITGAITKLLFGVSSVGVMFVWIGFNLGSVIYSSMQVILWSAMGVIDRLNNFNFMLNEIMPQYDDDRLIIDDFLSKSQEEKDYYIAKSKNRYGIKQIEMKNTLDIK